MVEITNCRSKESPDTCTHFGIIKNKKVCDIVSSERYAIYSLFECLHPKFTCPTKKVTSTVHPYEVKNVLNVLTCRVCTLERAVA